MRRWLMLSAGMLFLTSVLLHPGLSHAGEQTGAATRLRELHLLASALVERAASGRTPSHDYQIQVNLYREQLRRIMLADRERPTGDRLPATLLLNMVRMSALLHAAAECKSGLVITCPPDLLRQLRAQQAAVATDLRQLPGADGAL